MYETCFEALSKSAIHLYKRPVQITSQKEAFTFIRNALDILEKTFSYAAYDDVHKHSTYLAQKSKLSLSKLFNSESISVAPDIFIDAINNISSVLMSVSPPSTIDQNTSANIVELIIKASGAELEGWCSPEKARAMAGYIRSLDAEICVEIGVYGGRSLFPCAAALKHNGHGKIYGVESWSNDVAVENKTYDWNDEWWRKVDFQKIKRDVYTFTARHGLTSQVCIIEAPSTKVSHLFNTIDFLHIDGSHSMVNAATDVLLYGTKVRSGGVIVMDDIEWDTTMPAVMMLKDFCDELEVLENPSNGKPSAAFFRKR
ncbi:class I SAM-dependent methyltransferase [Agrobacterium larrymoorei]|uniref:O-methyltransferase YrrM n=1 Tax=Agrobacterium larrymoorei TaxID=160699 RepID=A0ABU0UI51_9HYPH|nr:class I SAM-dependent methyltransferase [Agrobacterium larrymoorei]MDQ1184631.1 putative O-methyltransferase YrrM [Agrobacterium larrymoorei]